MVELGLGLWQAEHSDLELELSQPHRGLQDPAFGFNPLFVFTAQRHRNPRVVLKV